MLVRVGPRHLLGHALGDELLRLLLEPVRQPLQEEQAEDVGLVVAAVDRPAQDVRRRPQVLFELHDAQYVGRRLGRLRRWARNGRFACRTSLLRQPFQRPGVGQPLPAIRAQVRWRERVAVRGCAGIGLSAVQIATARGVNLVAEGSAATNRTNSRFPVRGLWRSASDCW